MSHVKCHILYEVAVVEENEANDEAKKAPKFSHRIHIPASEIPYALRLGLTSNPTVFIGNAYASFGFTGVCIISVLVGFYMKLIDKLIYYFRAPFLISAYKAVAGLNGLFFIQIAAPTVLLTYGLATFPILFLVLDRFLFPARNWSSQGAQHG